MHERLDRADVNDPSFTRPQRRQEGLRDIEDAVEIDSHDVLPIFRDDFRIGCEAVTTVDGGVVNQNRDRSDLFRDLLGAPEAVLATRDVELKAFGLTAGIADPLDRLRCLLPIDVE